DLLVRERLQQVGTQARVRDAAHLRQRLGEGRAVGADFRRDAARLQVARRGLGVTPEHRQRVAEVLVELVDSGRERDRPLERLDRRILLPQPLESDGERVAQVGIGRLLPYRPLQHADRALGASELDRQVAQIVQGFGIGERLVEQRLAKGERRVAAARAHELERARYRRACVMRARPPCGLSSLLLAHGLPRAADRAGRAGSTRRERITYSSSATSVFLSRSSWAARGCDAWKNAISRWCGTGFAAGIASVSGLRYSLRTWNS